MIKKLATNIWNMSEYYNIPLGIFAPYILGLMVGSKPNKKKDNKCKNASHTRLVKKSSRDSIC